MEQIHELLGYKNIKIIQNEDMFKFSLDSMLLAYFVNVSYKTKKIIDLGCGNGPIPLFLTLKTKAKIIGVEIQEEVADMAKRSVELNNLSSQIEIINADLKNIYRYRDFANTFDIVVSNPPFFKYHENSNINKNDYLTIARHEVKAKLSDIINEAKKLLIDGGSLYMIHRAERLDEIFMELKKENFTVKNLQFVYPKMTSKEAMSVLIDAKKNRNPGLKVKEPLYIYQDNDEYTDTIKKIFNFNKPNE
ncbi:MAG TPA: tRNA1(Val) (adenine(37)-N6)-methyltransferase [Bacilli bacterium]